MIKYVDLIEDTICAPITAQGLAGVSVVRISGDSALARLRELCPFLPESLESHRIYFGELLSAKDKSVIDQVLISYFAKGKSFTGDEVLEISSHGNPFITNNILNELFKLKCRLAEPGEFSFRAFYNGKIDLVQAESVREVISCQTMTTGRWSLQQLSGGLSKVFTEVEKELLSIIGHLEAGIDFVEQDIDPSSTRDLLPSLVLLRAKVDQLAGSYDVNKNLVQGFKVLLVGETNAGKSSLFNRFFNSERAIVTNVAGTTRDLIHENTYIGSLPIRLTDTAGLRESEDPVEKIGIAKARKEMEDADALLWVIDSSKELPKDLIKDFPEEKTFYVFNKIDLLIYNGSRSNHSLEKVDVNLPVSEKLPSINPINNFLPNDRCFNVSAKAGLGLDNLEKALLEFLTPKNSVEEKDVVTQARHFKHLTEISLVLLKVEDMIIHGESPDLVSQELQLALADIHAILGKNFDDQILDTIFSEFCIGK